MDYWDKLEQLRKGSAAEKIVALIAEDIRDRKGIGNEMEAIDDDIVIEMLDGWVALIAPEMEPRWQGCTLPPKGWWCSRAEGHDGPCAARPEEEPVEDDSPLTGDERARIDAAWETHKAAAPEMEPIPDSEEG